MVEVSLSVGRDWGHRRFWWTVEEAVAFAFCCAEAIGLRDELSVNVDVESPGLASEIGDMLPLVSGAVAFV
jgi:hypothetical protein